MFALTFPNNSKCYCLRGHFCCVAHNLIDHSAHLNQILIFRYQEVYSFCTLQSGLQITEENQ